MPDEHYTIKIAKRPWWMWILALLWLLVEMVFLQTAVASHHESEPRAALISWIIFIVLAIAGVVWLRQGRNSK